ncbi:hypothetical protein E5676_scaffold475G001270 [Cucumis melo var. makuwa]|uniref:Transmembrane protein n=2 Tax=Cucumis melo TaxID=3656 RepID=A0A5D3CFJ4_CUCMM|nr:hypothetical protein E6C27_scaffold65G006000 [Cucumis melo var. makuwa]TYK09136.1 hypothetical protein E5676_scaffold475G001270 [Cucumis melo var. makuwa]
MVRVLADFHGGGLTIASPVFIFWAVVVSISIITTVIFSCTGGSGAKDKDTSHADTCGGAACAAGCGGGCGA